MWVLILMFSSSPNISMHDFADKAACESALAAAQEVANKRTFPIDHLIGLCVPKATAAERQGNPAIDAEWKKLLERH